MTDDPPDRTELPAADYEQLRRVAARLMRHEQPQETLQATALVHEAWLRLLRSPPQGEVRDRIGLLAHAMRHVLVDRARARNAARRGGGQRPVTLHTDAVGGPEEPGLDVLGVHDALDRLAAVDAELARLAELRIFGGLQEREIAVTLDVSLRTVERRWRLARAWLQRALGGAA